MSQRIYKTIPEYLKNNAVIDSDVTVHPVGISKKTGKLYKTTNGKVEKEAQRWANLGNKPIDWADKEHNIHQKLPEQWKYKPAKNPDELFEKGFDEIFTPNDIAQIEKYARKYEIDPEQLKYELYHDAIYRTHNNGSLALTNAKNDSMEEILGRIVAEGK